MSARFALPFLIALLAAGPAVAELLSITGEHDIGALLQRAREVRDLDAEDAVLLLDELREEWTADGRRIRSVHRVVYIRTAQAIRSHADLRVPHDGARQELTLGALRTWRLSDERWIESGPTARVETLPFELDRAPDYQDRRETMLLHDGVELPCVMETAYSIADREPYRAGVDASWTARRDEPAIVSRLVLAFAPGAAPTWAAVDGAPDPKRAREADGGTETLTFEAGPIDALPYHEGTYSVEGIPRVAWSTWRDWASLGTALRTRFDSALEIDDALRTAFSEHLEEARTPVEKLREIASFVGDSTRMIEYPIGRWVGPRSAARTWATAYGDRIDRAALAAALYREAGFTASLAFVGRPMSDAERRVPTLAWSDGPGVRVRGEGVSGYFDPSDATYSRGVASLYGRAVWEPSRDDEPSRALPPGEERSRIELLLDLAYDGEAQAWKGTGVLTATHALCPYDRMAGLDGEAREYLGALAGSVLDGAEVTGFNPEVFDRSHVVAGFAIEAPVGEPDDLGRLRLAVADPGELAGILASADVRIPEETRGSEIDLGSVLERRVELRLDPGDLEVVYLPRARTRANGAGRFDLSARQEEGGIRVVRHLVLASDHYEAAQWGDLRALLLADDHEGGRLVLLKAPE